MGEQYNSMRIAIGGSGEMYGVVMKRNGVHGWDRDSNNHHLLWYVSSLFIVIQIV